MLPRVGPSHNGSLAAWCQLAAACADSQPRADALQHCARVCGSWAAHFPTAPAALFVGPVIAAASSSNSHAEPTSEAVIAAMDQMLDPGNAGGVQRDLQDLHEQAAVLAAAANSTPRETPDPHLVPLVMACRLLMPPLPGLQVSCVSFGMSCSACAPRSAPDCRWNGFALQWATRQPV